MFKIYKLNEYSTISDPHSLKIKLAFLTLLFHNALVFKYSNCNYLIRKPNYVLKTKGGDGVIRELFDIVIKRVQ